ncbi:MAG: trypsin-like peptidase domain-containing protein [Oscillospiraceae bacterium]|nr:trypsin-like peptidase domain-containing protein [Oscillospiraceae bacterium]
MEHDYYDNGNPEAQEAQSDSPRTDDRPWSPYPPTGYTAPPPWQAYPPAPQYPAGYAYPPAPQYHADYAYPPAPQYHAGYAYPPEQQYPADQAYPLTPHSAGTGDRPWSPNPPYPPGPPAQQYPANYAYPLAPIPLRVYPPARLQPPAYMPQKQKRRRMPTALIVTLTVVLLFASGFVGGFLTNRFARTDDSVRGPETSQQAEFSPPGDPFKGTETAPQETSGPSISTANVGRQAMTIPEIAAAVRQSVVEIKTEFITRTGWMGNFIYEGAGSGVIISADGYIVTNNHVISGTESITVILHDGTEHEARLIATDPKADIAVLKIEADGLIPAVFGDSDGLVVGETAIAIGNPLGELGGTVTAGIISALDRDIDVDGETMTLLQMDAAVNPGNSGGGLFNSFGELIGIVNAKSGGYNIEGLGFAIPSNTAKSVISDLMEYGYVKGRVDAGLELLDIQTPQAARVYRIEQLGLYIYSSVDDRLHRGDRISYVDGVAITCLADFDSLLKTYQAGDKISISVVRSGETLVVELTLKEWRP